MVHKYRNNLAPNESEAVWIINVIEDTRDEDGSGCLSFQTRVESRHRVQSRDDIVKRWRNKLSDHPNIGRIEICVYAATLTGSEHDYRPRG